MVDVVRRIPEAFKDLCKPARFKIYYGGRGGAKSWAFAEEIVFRCLEKSTRVLCVREFQNSISESVYSLIADTIKRLQLSMFFKVLNAEIRCPHDGVINFKGIRHNPDAAKSMEGIDILWVEEAQNVSERSWEVILPTVRKKGSEIWATFNPKYPSDPVYKLFVANPRENSIVKKVSWRDNPWFSDELKSQMEYMKKHDYDGYLHVWEGEFDKRYTGAVYAQSVAHAREDGRVKDSGIYDSSLPVNTAWDLGYDDATAIWFWQNVGSEVRLIDYYEASNEDIKHYCGVIADKKYKYKDHFVPHDGANKLLAAGGRSIVQQAYALGVKMRVVPSTSIINNIAAARKVLGNTWIDSAKCKEGIDALEAYEFLYDDDKKKFRDKPNHNWASHACDAFEIIAQVLNERVAKTDLKPKHLTINDVMFNRVPQQQIGRI